MTPDELAERRKALRLTQAQLGAKIGVPQKTISRWELGMTIQHPRMLALALSALEHEERHDDGDAD